MNQYKTSVSKGVQLEGRIQNLLFHQGYFAIRDIFIPGHIRAPGASTPDIDVLGCSFTEDFLFKKIIYDCKSGGSQAVNRILWLQTITRRINADRVYMVRARTQRDIKLYGLSQGVYFIDFETLSKMEQDCTQGTPLMKNSTGYDFLVVPEALKRIGKNSEATPTMRVISTQFWFQPSCDALKQVIAQYEQIGPKSTLPNLSLKALQWLKAMLISLFTIGVLRICGEVISLSQKEREEVLRQRLVSDKVPYTEFNALVRNAFEYAYTIFGKQAALPLENYYEIPPPDYTDSLLDLIERALSNPKEAILMPRFSECVLFNYELLGENIDVEKVEKLFARPYTKLQSHYRDYLFFLNRICPTTKEFLKGLFPSEIIE